MRIIYCDCCRRKIRETEQLFSLEIRKRQDKEIVLNDMCSDCYKRIKDVIDNAEL